MPLFASDTLTALWCSFNRTFSVLPPLVFFRLKEHHRAVNVSDANNGIAVHANEHDHPVDWSSAKILHKETNFIKRKVVEALHISETKHTMNLDQGLRLNPTWQTLTIDYSIFFCIISFFCNLTDEGLRSETSDSNSVRNIYYCVNAQKTRYQLLTQ